MNSLMQRYAVWKWGGTGSALVFFLLAWLFTGIASSYSDEESKSRFFLKHYPTFQIQFFDVDDSESDYVPFSELPIEKRAVILDYCKYRFGVTSAAAKEIEACRRHRTRAVPVQGKDRAN